MNCLEEQIGGDSLESLIQAIRRLRIEDRIAVLSLFCLGCGAMDDEDHWEECECPCCGEML